MKCNRTSKKIAGQREARDGNLEISSVRLKRPPRSSCRTAQKARSTCEAAMTQFQSGGNASKNGQKCTCTRESEVMKSSR